MNRKQRERLIGNIIFWTIAIGMVLGGIFWQQILSVLCYWC